MPTFAYAGRTRGGETVTGERVADTMDAVVAALRREQVLVTSINPIKEKAAGKTVGGKKRSKSVSAHSLAVFVRKFSVMIDAGRTRGGETVTGERVADTMDAVVAALRREQVLVTSINPIKEK